jgi:hypothetical protein
VGYDLIKARILELSLDRAQDYGVEGLQALCPAHDDNKASLHLSEADTGDALLHCFAGCQVEDVVEALDLKMSDLFEVPMERKVVAEYVYEDENSKPLYKVLRFEPKGFSQQRWDKDKKQWVYGLNGVPRVLYNLPAIKAHPDALIYLVEGEKDADAINAIDSNTGHVGSSTVGGAGNFGTSMESTFMPLRGRRIVIVPDLDGPGEAHARKLLTILEPLAASVQIKYPVIGKDVSDHLAASLGLEDLVSEADVFEPIDWESYQAPEVEWLYEPYIPTRGRVLIFGKAGSLKSLWAMWIASKLAHQGKKVAYFSLEMRPEQSVARLKKLRPPKNTFRLYTNYSLGDPYHRKKTIEALKGFDLIVIDSWNAAYRFSSGRGAHDDQVAALDTEFFQPIIDGTGATLVVIDNTGHDERGLLGRREVSDHARGSSAKGDKMDVTIFLHRPHANNNYLTEVEVKKMRYDIPIPKKELVVAPSDDNTLEFYWADPKGKPEALAWEVPDPALGGGEEVKDLGGGDTWSPQEPSNTSQDGEGGVAGSLALKPHGNDPTLDVASPPETPLEGHRSHAKPSLAEGGVPVPRETLSIEEKLAIIQAERIFKGQNND